jgi:arginine N-succinyltransferase
MHFEGYIDIFDAGPVLQARVSELRALRESALLTAVEGATRDRTEPLLVSNTRMSDFRMIVSHSAPGSGKLTLSAAQLDLLHCSDGDLIRTLPINVRKTPHA